MVLWGALAAIALFAGLRAARDLRHWRAIAWTPRLTRLVAGVFRGGTLSDEEFFTADGAGGMLVARRRAGLDRLSARLAGQSPVSAAWGREQREQFSDLRFTDASRVPFGFAGVMRERFNLYSVVTASSGPRLQHLDGHWTLDVSGSYGLNVAGWDHYKQWIEEGWARVKALGPVLGAVHPLVADNIRRLKAISGMDEVSFHMSGTEAVMAAVRLARFNTRRKLVVTFSGAYHGWWDGVQPGLGSERAVDDVLAVKDMHEASLQLIASRARAIAAVLVNPIQSFHPNQPPPNDAILLTSDIRKVDDTDAKYRDWLRRLRAVCREHNVPLVLDEVYTGFRLAPGGAQEYFGIDADMVVYGKTLGGGMPIGAVCGKSWLMRRVDPAHPMRMAYVVGTFSAHPLVMGAMDRFLDWAQASGRSETYAANAACAAWARTVNDEMARAALPIRVQQLGTVWTVLFTAPGRFNWLYQYYLRAEGLTLSWVGTGRCLVSFDFAAADYDQLRAALVNAASAMQGDGWWPTTAELPERDRLMQQHLKQEVIGGFMPAAVREFYRAVMKRKDDDHHASHNNVWNQYLHLLSSSGFIYCYLVLPFSLTQAMFLGLAALLVRQFGHAVLEPVCHDEEALLLGFNTPSKTLVVGGFLLIPVLLALRVGALSWSGIIGLADQVAVLWFWYMVAVVGGRIVVLSFRFNPRIAMIWFVKFATDPFTDLLSYRPWKAQGA
jgi:glutamate-1-semialdehyde 2,1-aminomutase